MYYIYHIPKVKIGCSTQPKIRVEKQGYTEFETLESHSDIYIASQREVELQKQYGYKVDKQPYNQTISIRCQSNELYEKNRLNGLEKVKSGKWKEIAIQGVKANSIMIQCFDYKTKVFIAQFPSLSEAARFLKLKCIGNISLVINGKRNQTGGYFFKKITNP